MPESSRRGELPPTGLWADELTRCTTFAGSRYTLCDLQAAKFNVQRDVPASGIPTLL